LIFRAPGEERGALINHQDRAEIRRLLGLADRWLAVRRIGNQMGRESSAHPKLVRSTLRAAHGVVPVQVAIIEALIGEARKVPLGLMVQADDRRGRASGRGRVHRTATTCCRSTRTLGIAVLGRGNREQIHTRPARALGSSGAVARRRARRVAWR